MRTLGWALALTSSIPAGATASLISQTPPTIPGTFPGDIPGLAPGEATHPLATRISLSSPASSVLAWIDFARLTNSVIHVGGAVHNDPMPRGLTFEVYGPLDDPGGLPEWPKYWTAAPGTPLTFIRDYYLELHAPYLFASPLSAHDPMTIHRQAWASGYFEMPAPGILVPESPWTILISCIGVMCAATGRRRS